MSYARQFDGISNLQNIKFKDTKIGRNVDSFIDSDKSVGCLDFGDVKVLRFLRLHYLKTYKRHLVRLTQPLR